MSETEDTRHPETGELYPPKHPAHLFTTEEVEDILRFAHEHSIYGANEARLIAFIRDVRAAHLRRAIAKGKPASWSMTENHAQGIEPEAIAESPPPESSDEISS